MIFVVVALTALSVGLLIFAIAGMAPGQSRVVKQRLAAIQSGSIGYRELKERRRRQKKRERFQTLLESVGEAVKADAQASTGDREFLTQAGYRAPSAVTVYVASRLLLAGGLAFGSFTAVTWLAMPALQILMWTLTAGLVGWMLPFMIVKRKKKKRQRAIEKYLPDALDLLVVCVESGLGLNQALNRVAEEIDRICPPLNEELTVVNLEIRAGTPRDEALRKLGERTGVSDLRALVTMLIQTDRFGTSVANALRVHADSLRTKRRQRAEEKAAKTSVKMIFPLVLFIFPATSVVILGPGLIQLFDMFQIIQ